MRTEFPEVESQLPAFTGLIRYLVKNVYFLVNVLNEIQPRESSILNLAYTGKVGGIPEQHGIGRLAVASGPAGLLEISLGTVRKVKMDDEPDVRLVDAHPESVGTDHDPDLPGFPRFLPLRPDERAETGMVERAGHPLRGEEGSRLLAFRPVPHIDYPGTIDSPADIQELPFLVGTLPHHITEIGPLETGFQHQLFPEGQLLHNVFGNTGGGRGGEGDDRGMDSLPQLPDLQVIRPEIISPLGYTMGLIYDYITDIQDFQVGPKQERPQPLGTQVEELVSPVGGIVQGQVNFLPAHSGMHRNGFDTPLLEVLDLVFHQGDQRRDHEGEPVGHQARNLETDRLPSTGRKHREHVFSVEGGRDDLFLHRAERIVSPPFSQNIGRFHRLKHFISTN